MAIEFRLGTPGSGMSYHPALSACPVCGGLYSRLISIYIGEPICSDCGEWALQITDASDTSGGLR